MTTISNRDIEALECAVFAGPAIPMPANPAAGRTWDGMLIDRKSWAMLRDLARKLTADDTRMTEDDRALCSAWESGYEDIWPC